ncbi:MAG: peptidylprolyl isomerase, partial [Actinomycetota bacterium]|nr:peptidylprolyl isomerase [Actinomycetota bacterium]
AAQFAQENTSQLQPDPGQYAQTEERQRQILTQLIHDMLVAQRAGEFGISVTGQDVQERFEEFGRQFGSVEQLREEIARLGRSERDVRDQISAILRGEAVRNHFAAEVQVSDAAVRAAYRQRLETEYRIADVAHILVESDEQARELVDQLRAGADFAALARERSTDRGSAARGGNLGPSPRGTFVAEFERAVWAAQEGEIVGPVKTQFGYHVIRVNDFREVPFAQVEQQLREELAEQATQERYEAWFRSVIGRSRISVKPRFGRWDSERMEVVPGGALPPPGAPAELPPTATPGAG